MDITIPAWAVVLLGVFIPILVSWAIWITRAVFKNKEDILINTTNDHHVNKELTTMNEKLVELKLDFKEQINSVKTEFKSAFDEVKKLLYDQSQRENGYLKDMLKGQK